ncbi:dolichyl-phosphate-mannose--protein mannosyltransferase [Nesterenkonia sp. HG001]|uniref:dolichyl-phosphate-mannose--protein mannosyltransferase n=1 Tax=Nesterenkonia sp. HG001 TaxID=2983207 RepID=UPI002AC686C3|nr:phospholipid carrier-dependent glycosyltransferase [Nesterenkonia sp. HG001]MDZ5078678.1 phospholipid carrier-dependent glycosyltransferase [Nesterenkonia sp. HG001]
MDGTLTRRRTSAAHLTGARPDDRDLRRRRLGVEPFRPGLLGWIVPALVTLLAAGLRLPGLGRPHLLIFDETYYAKDAYALLIAGHELVWPDDADTAWLAGDPAPTDEPSYVVHPPLGKWLIALGIQALGPESAAGWRISAAVAGTLSVLLVALIAQRMFRSVLLGGVAGVLTAVEGHHLVMSRVALLDIFLMLFVLAAFGALLADRYQGRRRLADSSPGAWLAWRPWRLLAGVLLGAAVAVKLSALAFLAVFGVLVILWDLQSRRDAGARRWGAAGLRDAALAVLTVLPVAVLTYLGSWGGWLRSQTGWGRLWHESHPAEGLGALVPGPLRSLWQYHLSATDFHTGLDAGHDYASTPWTWLFMGRPVSFHYESFEQGEAGCAASRCSQAILDLANPVIWWAGLAALVLVCALWLGRRDWRHGAILSGYAAGFAVWLLFPDRTMFFFYTIAYHPFLILSLVAVAASVLRAGTDPARFSSRAIRANRRRNTVVVLCFLLLATAVSIFFLPLWTGETITYEQWRLRMWLPSWI